MNAKVQFGIIFWWAKVKKEPNVDTVLRVTSIKATDPPQFCSSIYCPNIILLSKIIPLRISQSLNTRIQTNPLKIRQNSTRQSKSQKNEILIFFQIEFEFEEVSHKLPNNVWQHFWRSVKFKDPETNKRNDYIYMCKCKYCGQVMKSGSTNMRKHLKAYHKAALDTEFVENISRINRMT